MRNWAGNLEYAARRLRRPRSIEQVQQCVADADRVRPLGTRHSFSPIADTTGDLVTLSDLPRVVDVDTVGRAVRVNAGLHYGVLAGPLHAAGLALSNTASLPLMAAVGTTPQRGIPGPAPPPRARGCRCQRRGPRWRTNPRELDPSGKFGNDLVDRCIGLGGESSAHV
jgi:hypothetical protein